MSSSIRRITAVISAIVLTLCCTLSMPRNTLAAEKENFKKLVDELAVLVNEAREAEGLEPLYLAPALCEISELRANECAQSFSHTRPDGSKSFTTIDYSKIPYTKFAENIAAGRASAERTFEQWKNSPDHWAIIMSPAYTHLGIGVAHIEGSLYGWYWVQTFVALNTELEDQHIVKKKPAPPKKDKAAEELIVAPKEEEMISFAYGDLNDDGMVDEFDYAELVNYVTDNNVLTEAQLAAGDVMKDGVVDITDVLTLREYLVGNIKSLPITPDMINDYKH